jgi:hypothetical protein
MKMRTLRIKIFPLLVAGNAIADGIRHNILKNLPKEYNREKV